MANFLKSLFIKGVEIDTAGASTGNVLSYNGTKFAPAAPGSGSLALDDLSDVVVTSPEEFQGLSYNGVSWVNSHIPLVSYVRNAESTTITTGTCVYLFGATGDHATVKRADNNNDSTSAKTIGVAGANITASNNGPVVTRGYVDGIDLSSGYTAGDVLWLGENGAFTTTKPTAPDHLVFIGVVVRATNNGIIYVATQNGYELDELHNVSLPSPNSGEFLKYNGSLWVADGIDLGTDTTGNYMSGISGTSPVSVAHTPSEGSSATVSLANEYGDTQNPYGSKTANTFLAAPNGSNGVPSFRAIAVADVPTLNQNTTGTASNITASSNTTLTSLSNLVTVGTITSGTWSGSFGSVSGANLTSLNASNLGSGTVPSARISGSYTGITAVGTLTAGSIPTSLLTGTLAVANGGTGVTTSTGSGSVVLSASPTLTGTTTYSIGSFSSTGGTVVTPWTTSATTTNFDGVDLRLIRRTTGSDWTTAYYRLGRLVDSTRMGFVQFGSSSGTAQTVELGIGSTSYISVNGTTGLITVDLPITSTQSFSATNSGNQNNYVKLGTISTDVTSNYGFTAYGNVRTSCGFNTGISWISTGASAPSGFTPNAHALFLALGSGGPVVSGDIRSNANNATSYNTTSDYRLKKDVVDIVDGISRIRQLKPKRFKFIDDPDETLFDGFLAHEVQDIVPVAVSGEKDAVGENGYPLYQQIDTSWMVALLTAGIKELDSVVKTLQDRVNFLESQIS